MKSRRSEILCAAMVCLVAIVGLGAWQSRQDAGTQVQKGGDDQSRRAIESALKKQRAEVQKLEEQVQVKLKSPQIEMER